MLFCDSLGGRLPAGELTGDDVIVVTNYLPTAAEASAAQAALLEAGAAQAAVVGPAVTAGQLAALVSAGLSQGAGRARLGLGAGAVRQRQLRAVGARRLRSLTSCCRGCRSRGRRR